MTAPAARPPIRVIAVDGPSGSGKSTVAAGVARALGWQHLDTGSMYRAVAFLALEQAIEPDDERALERLLDTVALTPALDGQAGAVSVQGRVLAAELRTTAVTQAVSAYAARPGVRARLVADQQSLATSTRGIVIEGRDIGTVVAPDAAVKVFLTAREEVRASRRAGQQQTHVARSLVQADLARRDEADSRRSTGPLACADDAVVLDTTDLSADEVVAWVLDLWQAADPVISGAGSTEPLSTRLTATDPATSTRASPGPMTTDRGAGEPAGVRHSTAGATEPQQDLFRHPHLHTAAWRARTDTRSQTRGASPPPYSPALVAVLKPIARVLSTCVWRVQVSGLQHLPEAGPVLIVGTHAGALDGPLVVAYTRRPVRILAKIELYRGALGAFLHRVGQIPVDRGRPDRVALHAAIDVLADGGVLGIFPEGTRGSGEVRDVRGGAAYLALHAPCTVVPVVCTGTTAAWPKGSRLPRLRVRIRIDFGAPIAVAATGDPRARSTVARATETIREGMAAHLASVREPAV